ncbi:MAG TPA: SDR family NAD(P)-dependent oxidoreductase [Candidatus Acidoferrales bacterium]|nr:SDR family NAD(P)-dependent oxidoreductase [Candidatus Acidoferrales bacterium]
MNIGKPLAGKVAIITGASRGIGFAVAHRLGTLGAKVGVCARDAGKLKSAADELRPVAAGVLSEAVDVTQGDQILAFVQNTEKALGPVEILVNNAGIGYFGPTHEATEANWDSVLDTNLKAVFLASKAVAPGMIQRRSGHIINIASLAGKNAFAGGGIYCASKWGLLGLTECMAEDLRGYQIRVSAVCPGSVATDFSPQGKKDISKMLQAEDIALVVEMILRQAPQSFISEVLLRPTQKP